MFVRRRGTTVIPNSTVFDDRLGYAAVGLLAVILARPESAPQGYRALMGRGLGQDGVRRALRELTDAGYRHQVTHREPDGRVLTFTIVSEEPISDDIARNYLREKLSEPHHRAPDIHARSDLRKHAKAAGRTVRGSPGPGQPGPGETGHLSNESQGEESLRSPHRENQARERAREPVYEHPLPPDFRSRDPRLPGRPRGAT